MAGPYKSEASNFTVTLGGTNITAYLTQSEIAATVAEVDSTNLASTGAESAPAATTWTLNAQGFLDKASDDIFGRRALTPPSTYLDLVVTAGPTGAQTIYTWTGTTTEGAFIQTYTIPATEPTQLSTFTAEIGVSGGPVRTTG